MTYSAIEHCAIFAGIEVRRIMLVPCNCVFNAFTPEEALSSRLYCVGLMRMSRIEVIQRLKTTKEFKKPSILFLGIYKDDLVHSYHDENKAKEEATNMRKP